MHQIRSIAALIVCLLLGLFVRPGSVCARKHALTCVYPSLFLLPPGWVGVLMRGCGDDYMGSRERTVSGRVLFFGSCSAMDWRTSICVVVRRRDPRPAGPSVCLEVQDGLYYPGLGFL